MDASKRADGAITSARGISFEQATTEIERAVAVLSVYWDEDKLVQLAEFAASCGETHVASLIGKAIVERDVEREWQLTEEGEGYAIVKACCLDDALDEARGNVYRANYGDAEGTIWIDVSVSCAVTEEEGSDTVQLDEPEPECSHGEGHDWQSPHEIVGGCESNPGVWGHGGGVIITEVCMRCGCARVTDTWAQRPDNGEQGLTSVSYEAGKYSDEIATEDGAVS